MLLELTRFWLAFHAVVHEHPAAQARPGSDANQIRSHVRAELDQVERCYLNELSAQPDLEGTATLYFTIGSSGQVRNVLVDGMGPELDGCIESVFRALRFPPPEDGGFVNVTYPFTFRRE